MTDSIPSRFEALLEPLEREGLRRFLRRIGSSVGPVVQIDDRELSCFCSNNYLGLADDPRLIRASIDATRARGAGSGASRLISGNLDTHEQLEAELADFKRTEAALLFNSGYQANIGAIPALAGRAMSCSRTASTTPASSTACA